jgi:hypothetical protein
LDLLGSKGAVGGTCEELSERIRNLPTQKGNKEANTERGILWGKMDNGNNLMSLAEIENSVYVVLKLPIVLGLKPVLKAAFNNAKTALKAEISKGDHYVSKGEFRVFL